MIIIYGTGTFGPVDELEGVGRVETKFAHLVFTPIIPLFQSFIVLEAGEGEEPRALPIPVSYKSIVCAWSRSVAFWGGLSGLVAAVASAINTRWLDALLYFALSVIGFLSFVIIGALLSRCSAGRRAQLLALLGMDDSDHARWTAGMRAPSHPHTQPSAPGPTGGERCSTAHRAVQRSSYPPQPSYPSQPSYARQPSYPSQAHASYPSYPSIPPHHAASYPPSRDPARSSYPPAHASAPPAPSYDALASYPLQCAYPPQAPPQVTAQIATVQAYAAPPPPDYGDDAPTIAWAPPEVTEVNPHLVALLAARARPLAGSHPGERGPATLLSAGVPHPQAPPARDLRQRKPAPTMRLDAEVLARIQQSQAATMVSPSPFAPTQLQPAVSEAAVLAGPHRGLGTERHGSRW